MIEGRFQLLLDRPGIGRAGFDTRRYLVEAADRVALFRAHTAGQEAGIRVAALELGDLQEALAAVEAADHLVGDRMHDLFARHHQAQDIPFTQPVSGIEVDQVLVIEWHDNVAVDNRIILEQLLRQGRQGGHRSQQKQ